MFTLADYVVLALYFAVLTAIGLRFYRRSGSAAEFFVGGRAMSWLPVAISVIAADTSAITILGNPGYSFEKDLRLVFYILAYSASAWLVIVIFLPFYCRLNMFTAYEYLERRFDVRVRSLASALFLFIRGAHVSIAMYAPALILATVSGMPLYASILLMGVVTTLYTTLGGIRAVIWTDVMQFSIVMTGVALTFFLAAGRVEGGWPAIWQIGQEAGKWRLFDFSFDWSSSTSFWAMFLGGTVGALATMGTDQAVLQRYFTAKSEAECSRSLKWYSVLLLPYNISLIVLGIPLFAFYRQHPDRAAGITSADAVLGYFAVNELPRAMASLLVGSVFAASMGVMSAGINSLSTCAVVDFYRRLWRPNEKDAHYVSAGRIFTLLWGALATAGAMYAGALGSLALAFGKIQGFVGGVMLGIFLLGMLFRRPTALGALIGGALGMAAVSWLAFRTDVSFFWYGAVGCLSTILIGYAASAALERPVLLPDYLFLQRRRARTQT